VVDGYALAAGCNLAACCAKLRGRRRMPWLRSLRPVSFPMHWLYRLALCDQYAMLRYLHSSKFGGPQCRISGC
jgi:hypothetical protein